MLKLMTVLSFCLMGQAAFACNIPEFCQDPNLDHYVLQDAVQTLTNKTYSYSPASPSKWASPAPTDLAAAIDRLANKIYLLNLTIAIP